MSLKAPLVPICTPSALDGHPLGLLPNTALPFLGVSLCYLTLFLLGREPQNTSTPFYSLKAFHYCTSSCSVSSKVFIHRPFLSGSQTDPFPGNPGFPLYILPASLFFSLLAQAGRVPRLLTLSHVDHTHTLLLCLKCSHQPLRSSPCFSQPPGHLSQHACGPTRSQPSSNTCTLVMCARPDTLGMRTRASALKHGGPSCQATLQAALGPHNLAGMECGSAPMHRSAEKGTRHNLFRKQLQCLTCHQD